MNLIIFAFTIPWSERTQYHMLYEPTVACAVLHCWSTPIVNHEEVLQSSSVYWFSTLWTILPGSGLSSVQLACRTACRFWATVLLLLVALLSLQWQCLVYLLRHSVNVIAWHWASKSILCTKCDEASPFSAQGQPFALSAFALSGAASVHVC